MKVMHILNTSSFSGAENVAITIINATKDSVNSCYVSFDGSIRNILNKNNIQFIAIDNMSISEIRRAVKLFLPDIIHAHDYTTSVVAALSFVKTPIISHLHNNSPWIKTICPKSIMYLLTSFRIVKILGVSQSIFDEYIFGKIISKKATVIPNSIDTSAIIQKSKLKSSNNSIYDIAYLGRLSPPKNPLRFIRIIEQMLSVRPELKAVMIGAGEMEVECRSLLLAKGLTDIVDMLGFLENPYPILSRVKMLVMPSLWEGFGLAAVEALALGVTVIASPVGGLVDIVTEKCGKLCQSDEEFIAEISRLLDDANYRKTKSENAYIRAAEIDNSEKYTNDLLEIYTNICIV